MTSAPSDLAVPCSGTMLTFKRTQKPVTQVNHDATLFKYVKCDRSHCDFQMTGWNFPLTAKRMLFLVSPTAMSNHPFPETSLFVQ